MILDVSVLASSPIEMTKGGTVLPASVYVMVGSQGHGTNFRFEPDAADAMAAELVKAAAEARRLPLRRLWEAQVKGLEAADLAENSQSSGDGGGS